MDNETANLEPGQEAGQPQAEASEAEAAGSEFGEDILIEVDHPAFADLEEDGEPAPEGEEGGEPAPAQDEAGQDEGRPYLTIKHLGKEIPIQSQEEAQALAQMGLNYRYKAALMEPHLDLIRAAAPLLSDPQKAEALMEFIRSGGQPRPDQAGEAAQGKPPDAPQVYVRDPRTGEVARDENGNPILADRTFTLAVMDTIKQMGLERPKPEPGGQGPRGVDPLLASVLKREVVGNFAHYAKEAYQVEDFQAALPLIQEELVALGVRPPRQAPDGGLVYDPNDNPRTWDLALARLVARGGITRGQAPQTQRKRPENKSRLKEQGRIPSQNQPAPGGLDKAAALKRALATRDEADFVKAVEASIHHPGLEE